jgi:hypothetical protein
MFALNAARLLLRLIGVYGGQAWLEPVNSAIYPPIVVVLFVVNGVWLWRVEAAGERMVEKRCKNLRQHRRISTKV